MEQQNYWQTAFVKYLIDHGIPYEIPANTLDVYLTFRGNYLPNPKIKISFKNEKKNYLFLDFRYEWAFDDAKDRVFQIPETCLEEGYIRCVRFNQELRHVRFSLSSRREVSADAAYYFVNKIDLAYLYELATILAASADFVYPVLASSFGIGQLKSGGVE